MSDLISRQAAIDALGERPLAWTESEYETGLQNQWEADVDAIKAVPPAQPEIIACGQGELVQDGLRLVQDCIDRQATMDFVGSMEMCDEISEEVYQKLMNYLEELPSAHHEQRWIPVSERLPGKEKKTYWVCTDTEYQCECRWTNNRFGLGEGEWGWSIFDTPQYSKPIAWMPLPAPYRKEGEEGEEG